ncbi:MAG: hypothetical protein WCK60_02995 [Candidatus Nomurabacteria bacterium]
MLIHQRVSFLAGLLILVLSAVEFRQASSGAMLKTRNGDRKNWKNDQRRANTRGSKRPK